MIQLKEYRKAAKLMGVNKRPHTGDQLRCERSVRGGSGGRATLQRDTGFVEPWLPPWLPPCSHRGQRHALRGKLYLQKSKRAFAFCIARACLNSCAFEHPLFRTLHPSDLPCPNVLAVACAPCCRQTALTFAPPSTHKSLVSDLPPPDAVCPCCAGCYTCRNGQPGFITPNPNPYTRSLNPKP